MTAAATTRAAPKRATAYPGRVGLGWAEAGLGFLAFPTFFFPFASGPGSPPDPADTPTSGWDSTARVRTGSSSPSRRGTASTSRGGSGGGISTFSARRFSGSLRVMAYLRLFTSGSSGSCACGFSCVWACSPPPSRPHGQGQDAQAEGGNPYPRARHGHGAGGLGHQLDGFLNAGHDAKNQV